MILTDDTPIDDDGLWKMEQIVYSTHHYDRCRELCMKDPVHTILLRDYFDSQVNKIKCVLIAQCQNSQNAKRNNIFPLYEFI